MDQWAALPEEVQREVARHLVDYFVAYKPNERNKVPKVDFYWKV